MQSDVARMPLPEDVDNRSLASEHEKLYSQSSELGKSSISSESDHLPGEDEVSSKEEECGMEVDSVGVQDLAAEELEKAKEYEAFIQGMPDCKESDDCKQLDDKSVKE